MKTEIVEQRLDTEKRELELEVDQPFYQIWAMLKTPWCPCSAGQNTTPLWGQWSVWPGQTVVCLWPLPAGETRSCQWDKGVLFGVESTQKAPWQLCQQVSQPHLYWELQDCVHGSNLDIYCLLWHLQRSVITLKIASTKILANAYARAHTKP